MHVCDIEEEGSGHTADSTDEANRIKKSGHTAFVVMIMQQAKRSEQKTDGLLSTAKAPSLVCKLKAATVSFSSVLASWIGGLSSQNGKPNFCN